MSLGHVTHLFTVVLLDCSWYLNNLRSISSIELKLASTPFPEMQQTLRVCLKPTKKGGNQLKNVKCTVITNYDVRQFLPLREGHLAVDATACLHST